MPRQKKYPDPVPEITDRDGLLRELQAIRRHDDEIATIREDRQEHVRRTRDLAVHLEALTLALRLAKQPGFKRQLFLECFDGLRLVLQLDDHQSALDPQTSLLDRVKVAAE